METETTHIPLLRTKFHRPPVPGDHVHRLELLERLGKSQNHPLILVSAPAGYGKSTLVSCWLNGCNRSGAWLALDENDNDLRQFLTYFVSAVQTILPDALQDTMALIEAPNLPPIPILATTLVNELDRIETEFIVVLDDIHLIKEKSIHDVLNSLLLHPPRPMQLVLVSRRDPILPIASLRGKGLLTEIRMQDLRFSNDEAVEFFQSSIGRQIDKSAADALIAKAEGWVTALRLAALAMRWQADSAHKLLELSGDTQYVMDYLTNEVLDAQPADIRHFLLNTSILNRFCAPLCDALFEKDETPGESEIDGQKFINWLQDNNLFLIPLDTENRWFRYHHLFQDLLQRQLKQNTNAKEIATLHIRASNWSESRGLITESIKYALAAGDVTRAAEIVERYRDGEFTADRWHVVERWLTMLPADILRERPKLLLTEAWIRYLQHLLARIPMLLDRAESLLRSQTAEPVVLAEIAFFRGYIAYFEGEAEQSLKYLENAVSTLAGTKSPILGETELVLGLARCMNGNNDLAVQALESRLSEIDSSEPYLLCRLIASLAFIHMLSGDLYQLQTEGQRLLGVSKKHKMGLAEAWGYYFLAFGYLHAGKLEAALPHFVQVDELRYVMEPRAAIDALAGLALTQQFLQREVEAEKSIQRLQEFARELNERSYFSLAQSCQARLSLLRGDVNAAVDWSRSVEEPPVTVELFSWFEAPAITQARALIADGSEESVLKAVKQIQSIRDLCEANRFTCQIIEIAVLQSLALEKQGRTDDALKALEEAVALAESGGWIRPFVELGVPMADLLKKLRSQNVAFDYIGKILSAFSDIQAGSSTLPVSSSPPSQVTPSPSPPVAKAPQFLVEPLTNRELEILEMLAQRLQNKEIAEKLFISPTTVKTHLQNIYQKLNVSNRREAVNNAKDLGIL